jgi:hypothetical protein
MTGETAPGTGVIRQVGTPIADLVQQGMADVSGVICSTRAMSIGNAPACCYTISDGTGELDLLFLGRIQIAGMWCGRHCRAKGTAGKREDRLVLWNPRYWLAATDSEPRDVPVIAISAREAGAARPAALAAGATGYLPKPSATQTLPAKIH